MSRPCVAPAAVRRSPFGGGIAVAAFSEPNTARISPARLEGPETSARLRLRALAARFAGLIAPLACGSLRASLALDPAANRSFVLEVGAAELALEVGFLVADCNRVDDDEYERGQSDDPSIGQTDADGHLE